MRFSKKKRINYLDRRLIDLQYHGNSMTDLGAENTYNIKYTLASEDNKILHDIKIDDSCEHFIESADEDLATFKMEWPETDVDGLYWGRVTEHPEDKDYFYTVEDGKTVNVTSGVVVESLEIDRLPLVGWDCWTGLTNSDRNTVLDLNYDKEITFKIGHFSETLTDSAENKTININKIAKLFSNFGSKKSDDTYPDMPLEISSNTFDVFLYMKTGYFSKDFYEYISNFSSRLLLNMFYDSKTQTFNKFDLNLYHERKNLLNKPNIVLSDCPDYPSLKNLGSANFLPSGEDTDITTIDLNNSLGRKTCIRGFSNLNILNIDTQRLNLTSKPIILLIPHSLTINITNKDNQQPLNIENGFSDVFEYQLNIFGMTSYDKDILPQENFRKCIKSINFDTKLTQIYSQAITAANYANLEVVKIPNTVREIGENAFLGIPKVIYSGPAKGAPWGAKEVVT